MSSPIQSTYFSPSPLLPLPSPSDESYPAFILEERPLIKRTDPLRFSQSDLEAIQYDKGDRLLMQDGEPDDFVSLSLYENRSLIIAEKHDKRKKELERAESFLKVLGNEQAQVAKGDPSSLPQLIAFLETVADHSLCITITAPTPTLTALIETVPDLLAQKTKRIVALGGFAHRPCEWGDNAGTECYYTTHNLSVNLHAAQTLFNFAERFNLPCFILSTDNLHLDRSLNFDLPHKIRQMEAVPLGSYLLADIAEWNRCHLNGKLKEKVQEMAERCGYSEDIVMEYSMTPADPIAAVFDLAFDRLEIDSRGISNVQITETPRFEKNGEKTKHRLTSFTFSKDSPIRYVDQFRLQGTELNTTQTVEVLLNHLLNKAWYKQLNQRVPLSSTEEKIQE